MITIIFMYAILALSFTAAKAAIQHATPFFLVGFRMITAGSILLTLQYVFNRKHFVVPKKDFFDFVKVAFFSIYLVFIPDIWAFQKISSSKAIIMYSITPFLVAIFAYFLAKERFSFKKILGMVIGFLGIFPILIAQDTAEPIKELAFVSPYEAALLVAIVSGAYAWFPLKKLMDKGYKVPMIHGITMFLGGIGAMITSLAFEGVTGPHIFNVSSFLFWVFLLIFISNGIFYNLYGWLLNRYSFTTLSFARCITPIFGAFFGWLILSEPITIHHLSSFCIITLGTYLFFSTETK